MSLHIHCHRLTLAACVVTVGLVTTPSLWAQGMEAVGQTVREDSVRLALEANLKITEAKVRDLQTKVDAMKACYTQSKMYTPSGCIALPPQKKTCTCNE
jgi:hypothetical protein